MSVAQTRVVPINRAPEGFSIDRDLPKGFAAFYRRLHEQFSPWQQELVRARAAALGRAHGGQLPTYLPPSAATTTPWRIELPAWCADQRNQMTGPADDAELVVKMLNSGAPGVMLDLEDSLANTWEHLLLGQRNIAAALYGELTYEDQKRRRTVRIERSSTVIFTRVRGLHLYQAGVYDELTPASLFDLALHVFSIDFARLRHPLCLYIPKSESAEEALWWRDVFAALVAAKGWQRDAIRCMALVESHPLAFELEEFAYSLRDVLLGLNLGRWDYMASLIDFTFNDPAWVLPDRNTIPHDVPFFQNLRRVIPAVCHRHGMLAIGGMTALYPSREDPELNARALAVLESDKRNEANCGMDGAWTGHPDQNAIAVAQFPEPNQVHRMDDVPLHPDMRPSLHGVGKTTMEGTRAAVRTVIRYRHGYLHGKGASLLDGYMEDLATDRIYRLMIAQRIEHGMHTVAEVSSLFDDELQKLIAANPPDAETYRRARSIAETMIQRREFDPA
ncbi:MAG: hypothetical protein JO043_02690 [Candidatus Eremiobacteraeota bacterium]|nr:hypothetical protein [Candidatus Eremiobacteraeota bacterium]